MKKNQNRPETGKIRRLLAAALSVMMLATSGFTTAWADTPEVTKNHYPSSARVGTHGYWSNNPPRLFLKTPYVTPASTSIYMWNGTTWTDFSDKMVKITDNMKGDEGGGYMAYIPDGNTNINALYKIVNTFDDGIKTEYIIQKNDAGQNYQMYEGGKWQPYYDTYYAGVTGADAYSGRLSFKLSNWSPRWDQNTCFAHFIRTYDNTKSYQVSFWYKSNDDTGAPALFCGYGALTGEKALNWKQKVIKRTVAADGSVTYDSDTMRTANNGGYGLIGFSAGTFHEADDFWVDDIEVYELDENGNKKGDNLFPQGDFEYHPGWDHLIPDGVANVTYEGIDGGVILKWQKEQAGDIVGTRVYNEDGHLIAELGSATELPLTSLENGKEYTYELRNVTTGGFECEGNRITVTAGVSTVKPAITDYYPIDLTVAGNRNKNNEYRRVLWINPDLNGINLTGVKFYDISDGTPVEINHINNATEFWNGDSNVVNLDAGGRNSILLPKNQTAGDNTLYRIDFTYSDGTTVSLATSGYAATENAADYWDLDSNMDNHNFRGRDYSESASGSASMHLNGFLGTNEWNESPRMNALYVGDMSGFETGKSYKVSLQYKTLLNKGKSYFRELAASINCLGTTYDIPANDSYDWTTLEFVVENATSTEVKIINNTDTALWIDNLSIIKLDENGNPTGENLIQDGGFEGEPEVSTITDAAYDTKNGGATVTWTRAKGLMTRVYLDGVKIADVNSANARLPITGLEYDKEYTVVLKEVMESGRECDGVSLTVKVTEPTPVNDGIANVTYDGITGGVILSWQIDRATTTTLIYDGEGNQIANLTNGETEYRIEGLTDGEEYTYVLKNVAENGYVCEGNKITVTAGVSTVKPAITDYYPIDLTVAGNRNRNNEYRRVLWINPDLNGINLTGVKFYDISDGTPAEINHIDNATEFWGGDSNVVNLDAGGRNSILLPKNKTAGDNTLYRIDFTYSDGTTVSLATSGYAATENAADYWDLDSNMDNMNFRGRDYSESASGSASMHLNGFLGTNEWTQSPVMNALYVGDTAGFVTGESYKVSLQYKTLLHKSMSYFRDKAATVKCLGTEYKLPLNDSCDWKPLEFVVENATDNEVKFINNTDVALWIDDLSIIKLDENGNPIGENLIQDGGFEGASEASTITGAKYVGTDDGIAVTWTRAKGLMTRVYLDGIKIADVNSANARLPITGLESGKEYTVVLKEVMESGRECDGVTLKIAPELTASDFEIKDRNNNAVDTIGGIIPKYTVSANISNTYDEDKTVMIAYAMYDANGKLLTINHTCQTITAGTSPTISVVYEYIPQSEEEPYMPADISYAKIFLWNMTDNMEPLADSRKLDRNDDF